MKYIDVAIDNKSEQTDTLYTYGCREDQVQIGQKVYVPFGRGDKVREAYVFRISDEPDKEYKNLKYTDHLDEDICLTQEIISTCTRIKKRVRL